MRYSRMRLLLAALICLTLNACASLNETECRQGDWLGIGTREGLAGLGPQLIHDHRKACTKFAITPDSDAWETGRQQGLRRFCAPHNAVEAGYRGYHYSANTCPADMEAAFLPAWRIGAEAWRAQWELDQLRERIRSMEAELTRLKPGPARDATQRQYNHLVGNGVRHRSWRGFIETMLYNSELERAEHNAWRASDRMIDYQRKLAQP